MHKLGDELADIMADVLFVADGLGIDMYQSWDAMLNNDKRKIKERSA
jgi:NTP pyrophosphatase (non-canonical NTP hydrolase)